MAVQLLENWLLKEQGKIQTKYSHLNQVSVVEPDILFIGIPLSNTTLCRNYSGLRRRLSIEAFEVIRQGCY